MKNFFLIILTLAVLGLAGYIGYNKFIVKPANISSYEDCVNAKGSVIQTSYPATCVTKSGQRFTENIAATPAPPTPSTPTPVPSSSPVSQGVVTGKLCYPSNFLPPGEIVAKDQTSGKTYTQKYVGSMAGGASTYSFNLPGGTYHLRYQAHASTTKPDIFTSGYYDECAKTMATTECTPDSGHISIIVTVAAGQAANSVDLCDFYYNPTQAQSLDQGF